MERLPIFDRESAMLRVDQDEEFFAELLEVFFSDIEERLDELKTAISSKVAKDLESGAHSLKSALGNLGAMRAHEQAFALEKSARESGLSSTEQAEQMLTEFKKEIEAFRQQVQSFMSTT
ncbi:MAG: Hpt domain-containing protein [Leptospiraceae bacterium]|nr:Hpt domain-containing protein [Leptospiraceae bacterium]